MQCPYIHAVGQKCGCYGQIPWDAEANNIIGGELFEMHLKVLDASSVCEHCMMDIKLTFPRSQKRRGLTNRIVVYVHHHLVEKLNRHFIDIGKPLFL